MYLRGAQFMIRGLMIAVVIAAGLVRNKGPSTGPYDCYRPIRGDWWHVGLGGGWCYHQED
jgi:hypothetical protein